MTKKKPTTWRERVDKAIDRAAIPLSLQPGNLKKTRVVLRNELRQSVAGLEMKRFLAEFGNQPADEHVSKARDKHPLGIELIEKWEKGEL